MMPINFNDIVDYPSKYSKVELRFNYPGTGAGAIYGYDTKCLLHLLEYIFSQLPIDYTRDEFQSAAYKAIHNYEYDGSVYLNREELEALHLEMTTCVICGARGETNAHNTCSSAACELELDQLFEGV